LKKNLPGDWIQKEKTEVFLCGPAPMMNAVEKALLDVGFPEEQIHTERYTFV
jgi:ferredoxin-NADP reductase